MARNGIEVYTCLEATAGNVIEVYTCLEATAGNGIEMYTCLETTTGNVIDVYTCLEAKTGNVEVYIYRLHKASNTAWKRSMVPERKLDWNFTMDKKIHGESNQWSTAPRQKRIY